MAGARPRNFVEERDVTAMLHDGDDAGDREGMMPPRELRIGLAEQA